jgi:hypothetical protein
MIRRLVGEPVSGNAAVRRHRRNGTVTVVPRISVHWWVSSGTATSVREVVLVEVREGELERIDDWQDFPEMMTSMWVPGMTTSMQQVAVPEVREGELEQKVSQYNKGSCASAQVVTWALGWQEYAEYRGLGRHPGGQV